MFAGRRSQGRRGERLAEQFLKRNGYRILSRNFTCPLGELDLVALRDGVVTFVEVRTGGPGSRPEESVDRRKQQQLCRLAQHFVNRRKLWDKPCQFDVIAVTFDQPQQPHLRHFADAFPAVET